MGLYLQEETERTDPGGGTEDERKPPQVHDDHRQTSPWCGVEHLLVDATPRHSSVIELCPYSTLIIYIYGLALLFSISVSSLIATCDLLSQEQVRQCLGLRASLFNY